MPWPGADDLEFHAVAVVLAGVERPVCGDPVDNFPPKPFGPLIAAARAGSLTAMIAMLKARPARSLPNAYGWLTHGDLPHDLIGRVGRRVLR